MPEIRLPQFEDSYCRMITVCGRVLEEEGSTGEALIDYLGDVPKVGGYNTASGRAYVRVFIHHDEKEDDKWVHVDLAKKEFFGDRKPTTTHRRRELQRLLGKLEGVKLRGVVTSEHAHPKQSSGLSRMLPGLFEGDDTEVRLTGAEFSFPRESGIIKVRFQLTDDEVQIHLGRLFEGVVSENYLAEQLKTSERFLAVLCEGTRHGSKDVD
jgi:hypothetical protein